MNHGSSTTSSVNSFFHQGKITCCKTSLLEKAFESSKGPIGILGFEISGVIDKLAGTITIFLDGVLPSHCRASRDIRPSTDTIVSITSAESSLVSSTIPPVCPKLLSGITVADRGKAMVQAYLGMAGSETILDKHHNPIHLLWQPRASKKQISVSTSPIPDSTWQVLKAITAIQANKQDVLQLLIDDDRVKEFDDMIDNVEVNFVYCFYFPNDLKLSLTFILCFVCVAFYSLCQFRLC